MIRRATPLCAFLALVPTCLASTGPLGASETAANTANPVEGPGAPVRLRVEYKTDPIGIDEAAPRFSWEVNDTRRGAVQSAFRVLVSENVDLLTQEIGDAWDSRSIPWADTNQIAYAGRELVPWRTYYWTVRTWDLAGRPSPWSAPARFTMGPMRPSDWTASWITSTEANRGTTGGLAGFRSANSPTEDDFKYIQFDFGSEVIFDNVILHPARPSGKPGEKGVLFPLRVKLYVDNTDRFDHTFMRAGEYTWQDIPDAGAEPQTFTMTRFKLRYLRIVVQKMQKAGDDGYAFALGEVEVRDGANNIAGQAKVTSGDSIEEGPWSIRALNDGELYPGQVRRKEAKPATLFRKTFTLTSNPKSALVAASALGLYEMTVNGVLVGDDRLAPGWTDYRARVPYRMYDVAPLLQAGENVVGVTLADGWYAGRLGLSSVVPKAPERGHYGDVPMFLAQMHVDDGSAAGVTVVTDETWKWSPSGPVRSADLLDGQYTDQRSDQRDWDRVRFADAAWKPAFVARPAVQTFAAVAEPVVELAPIPAVSVKELRPNTFLYDFGQNLSGVVRLRVPKTGMQVLQLRHGEALDANGQLYALNLRGAQQIDRIVLREGFEGAVESRFTVHGFRYVEIAGRATPYPVEDVMAVPLTAGVREVGSFECSDPTLTRLWRNIEWSRRSNFGAVPTDCPQRDERLGWTGDLLTFAQTAMFQADVASYLTQWLRELRGAQTEDGRFPDFAPNPYSKEDRWRGTPGWADAGVFVPWEAYLHYHDRQLLKSSVDSMIRWVDYVHAKNPTLVFKDDRGSDYGDWLNGSTFDLPGWTKAGNEVPHDVFATAFFARSCELTAKAAFASGRIKDAERLAGLARDVRKAFRAAFVDVSGRIQGDTQAGYALAVDFDLFAEDRAVEERAVEQLARKIEEAHGVLTTGFHATHRALLALSRHGRHELAMKAMTRTEAPSFAAQIAQGATTTWERMDGLVAGRGFADPSMNSFNHFAFGAVGEWMVRTIGGIEVVDDYPAFGTVTLTPVLDGPVKSSAEGRRAFEHVLLRPMLGGGVTWAKCSHDSISGRFTVSWKVDGDVLTYECTVPANASATLELPATSVAGVTEGGQPLEKVPGLYPRPVRDARISIDLAAGTYRFTSKIR